MTTTTAKRGVRVAIAAAAATLLASFGMAAPSSAATPDEARDGSSSLTIHKYEGASVAGENNGTELAVEPALPGLNDVEFTLQPVLTGGAMFDLATNDGWAAAQDLFDVVGSNPTAAELTAAGVTLGAGSTQITAGGTPTQGAEATFGGLSFGLYYVTETDAPAGTTPAAPFLVSVPLTNAADQASWLYDIHVYPKNSVSSVEKEVTDAGSIQLGDEVVFTITADIPDLAEDTPIDGYKIVDDLDEKLDHVSATVELPLTGGAGTTAIHAAGALILAGGLVLAARSRRAKA